jgi:hypothetical protein
MAASLSLDIDGLAETQRALAAVSEDLARKPSPADREVGTRLAGKLAQAAASCGVPVAPRASRSVKPTSAGVSVGATTGRRGGPSYALTWGSERGGRNFAAAKSSGYWIKPTVDQFRSGEAVEVYNRAIVVTLGKAGF